MQLIITLETKNKEGSDYYYLSAIRKRFYLEKGNKISIIFMNGKGNFDKISPKIEKFKKEYAAFGGKTVVIYFLDVDDGIKSNNQNKLNIEITKYCEDKNIELVWFKRDIEEVMLKKQLENKEKTQRARNFLAKDEINSLNEKDLSVESTILKNKQSNVLLVLDKYLERKSF